MRKKKEKKSNIISTEVQLDRKLSLICKVQTSSACDDENVAHGVAAVFDTFHQAISMYPDYPTRPLFIRVLRTVACAISGTLDEALEGKIAATYMNMYGNQPFQLKTYREVV